MYLVNDDGTISEVETTTFRAINWAEADVLREQIKALGYVVVDSKEGYKLEKI